MPERSPAVINMKTATRPITTAWASRFCAGLGEERRENEMLVLRDLQ
jgi:hypothetical protein